MLSQRSWLQHGARQSMVERREQRGGAFVELLSFEFDFIVSFTMCLAGRCSIIHPDLNRAERPCHCLPWLTRCNVARMARSFALQELSAQPHNKGKPKKVKLSWLSTTELIKRDCIKANAKIHSDKQLERWQLEKGLEQAKSTTAAEGVATSAAASTAAAAATEKPKAAVDASFPGHAAIKCECAEPPAMPPMPAGPFLRKGAPCRQAEREKRAAALPRELPTHPACMRAKLQARCMSSCQSALLKPALATWL